MDFFRNDPYSISNRLQQSTGKQTSSGFPSHVLAAALSKASQKSKPNDDFFKSFSLNEKTKNVHEQSRDSNDSNRSGNSEFDEALKNLNDMKINPERYEGSDNSGSDSKEHLDYDSSSSGNEDDIRIPSQMTSTVQRRTINTKHEKKKVTSAEIKQRIESPAKEKKKETNFEHFMLNSSSSESEHEMLNVANELVEDNKSNSLENTPSENSSPRTDSENHRWNRMNEEQDDSLERFSLIQNNLVFTSPSSNESSPKRGLDTNKSPQKSKNSWKLSNLSIEIDHKSENIQLKDEDNTVGDISEPSISVTPKKGVLKMDSPVNTTDTPTKRVSFDKTAELFVEEEDSFPFDAPFEEQSNVQSSTSDEESEDEDRKQISTEAIDSLIQYYEKRASTASSISSSTTEKSESEADEDFSIIENNRSFVKNVSRIVDEESTYESIIEDDVQETSSILDEPEDIEHSISDHQEVSEDNQTIYEEEEEDLNQSKSRLDEIESEYEDEFESDFISETEIVDREKEDELDSIENEETFESDFETISTYSAVSHKTEPQQQESKKLEEQVKLSKELQIDEQKENEPSKNVQYKETNLHPKWIEAGVQVDNLKNDSPIFVEEKEQTKKYSTNRGTYLYLNDASPLISQFIGSNKEIDKYISNSLLKKPLASATDFLFQKQLEMIKYNVQTRKLNMESEWNTSEQTNKYIERKQNFKYTTYESTKRKVRENYSTEALSFEEAMKMVEYEENTMV